MSKSSSGAATAVAILMELGLSAWLAITAASQHPHRIFDRFRARDRTGLLIPNWRFFAPEPATHDYHVLYRVLSNSGAQSQWMAASDISLRNWLQTVWFPRRRQDKAMFDICNELALVMGRRDINLVTTPGYKLLRDFVERRIGGEQGPLPQGFQFLVAQYSGYDDTTEPRYVFVSPFVPLNAGQHPRRAAPRNKETIR